MKQYSDTELANVQNYLMWRGHACPTIAGEQVHFICQESGNHRYPKTEKIDTILDEINNLKRVPISEEGEDNFVVRSNRLGLGIYQLIETNNKLLYVEELPIKLWGKF